MLQRARTDVGHYTLTVVVHDTRRQALDPVI
jgi:hypothetical protein